MAATETTQLLVQTGENGRFVVFGAMRVDAKAFVISCEDLLIDGDQVSVELPKDKVEELINKLVAAWKAMP